MNALELSLVWVFWLSIAAVWYTYAIYPVLVYVAARLLGRGDSFSDSAEAEFPTLSLLIAAYNEESVIDRRLRNALQLDYPPTKLQIVIASDGSTDRTAAIVQQYASAGVRLLGFPARRGKATVLNDAMAHLTGELVLLSDANTMMDADAARHLARWFADPSVGVVCGRLVLTDPTSGQNADSTYWRYETFLKTQEGRLGALVGSNGAIYAIRRKLVQPIPENTTIDDLVLPLLAKRQSGCRIVYERDAAAVEESAPDLRVEFRRRTRFGASGWQSIGLLLPLLSPTRGWIAFTFFSHKVLRWACPFFLVVLLFSNVLLAGRPFYRILLAGHVAFYAAAIAGRYVPGRAPFSRLLRLANMFASMNAALLVGFFRWLTGSQSGIWRPTRQTQ